MQKVNITVKGTNISLFKQNENDSISLTDIARYKNKENSADVVKNWLRNKNTIEFLELWGKLIIRILNWSNSPPLKNKLV